MPKQMTDGQRSYEAKRAAKAGMSLDKWMAQKERERVAEERERAKAMAKAAEPPKKPGFFSRLMERATKPLLIAAHADWSVDPRKRWITLAARTRASWRIFAPVIVGDVGALLTRLRDAAGGEPIVLGLDMPIGLPRAYAERHADQPDFPAFLRALTGRALFFEVCNDVAEICADRPFYPRVGVGMRLDAHVSALGLGSRAQMSRLCDLKTADRPAGASLFWTLGPNQVGKAALSGWRDLLLPCLTGAQPAHLWPFDGRLSTLVARGGITIAETYPAEALRQLGLRLVGSKRRQGDRVALAPALRDAMTGLDAECDGATVAALQDGFGAKPDGEDRFDSLLGLLCVLHVLAGRRDDFAPDDPWIRKWEGWVLGQTAPASSTPRPPRSTPPPLR